MTSHVGVYSVFEVDGECEPTEVMIGYLYCDGLDWDTHQNFPARLMRASLPYNATIPNIIRWGDWCLVDFDAIDPPAIMMFREFSGRGSWECVYLKKLSCEPREPDRRNVRRVEL